ncbi:hypothetical protein ACFQVA_37485 [Actinomadura keratinilytica]
MERRPSSSEVIDRSSSEASRPSVSRGNDIRRYCGSRRSSWRASRPSAYLGSNA